MSSDLATINLQTGSPEIDTVASGLWSESFVTRPEIYRMTGPPGHVVNMALAIVVCTATAVQDDWFSERRGRDVTTASWGVSEGLPGKPISIREARRLALQLMEEVEAARLQAAENEARHTFDLEDIS